MPSTYSNLKIQLMATGENNTTWGDVTNLNLGTALEEAIVGSADVAFSGADVTLTLTDTNASQTARNMRLNLTGTATAGYNLIVPSIEKPYIINNGTNGTITVKNATGTGVAIPAGKTMWVYNTGTNVVDAVTHLSSLTLTTDLAVPDGGTGASTFTSNGVLVGNGTSALQATAAGTTGQVLVGNTGGAPTWATLTSTAVTSFSAGTTGLTPATGTTGAVTLAGTLVVGNGGTGSNTAAGARTNLGVPANDGTGATGTWGINITGNAGNVTGTVAVANGGTGATSLTSGYLLKGNGTSAVSSSVVYDTGTNVGIGTASPGAKFQIQQDQATYSYFDYYNVTNGGGIVWRQIVRNLADTGITSVDFAKLISSGFAINNNDTGAANFTAFGVGGSERMRITSAGNVGIGTSAPNAKLDVVGNVAMGAVLATGTGVSTGDVQVELGANRTGDGPCYIDWHSTAGTDFEARVIRNTGANGTMDIFNTGTGGINLSNLGSAPIALGTNSAERMRIDSSGNVGIGTSAPNYLLHLNQNGNTQAWISATNAGSNSAGIGLENQGQRNWQIWADRTNDALQFGNNNRAVTNMAIKFAGQVRFIPLASAPSGAEAGDVYYDSGTNKLRCYNGTTWNDLF